MVVTAGKRLKSENGASLVAALLFFVLCGVAASMILAAASASAGKMQQVPVTDQKRFAVESGAAFLRDELSDSKTAVKITDVRVVDSREEEPDYSEEYVYTGGETLDDDSILGSCIKQVYTSLDKTDPSLSRREMHRMAHLLKLQNRILPFLSSLPRQMEPRPV